MRHQKEWSGLETGYGKLRKKWRTTVNLQSLWKGEKWVRRRTSRGPEGKLSHLQCRHALWMLKSHLQVLLCSKRQGRLETKKERNETKLSIDFMEIIIVIWNCSYSNVVPRKYISSYNGAFDILQKKRWGQLTDLTLFQKGAVQALIMTVVVTGCNISK